MGERKRKRKKKEEGEGEEEREEEEKGGGVCGGTDIVAQTNFKRILLKKNLLPIDESPR